MRGEGSIGERLGVGRAGKLEIQSNLSLLIPLHYGQLTWSQRNRIHITSTSSGGYLHNTDIRVPLVSVLRRVDCVFMRLVKINSSQEGMAKYIPKQNTKGQ